MPGPNYIPVWYIASWKNYSLKHQFFFWFLMMQVSSMVVKLRKEAPRTFILSNNHIPSKAYWEFAVNQALQIISRSDSELAKVLTAYVLSLFEALTNSGSE